MKKNALRILMTGVVVITLMAQLSIMPVKAATNWNDFTAVGPKSDVNVHEQFRFAMNKSKVTEVNPSQLNMVSLEGKEADAAVAMWARRKIDLTKHVKAESYMYLGGYPEKQFGDGLTLTFHNDSRGLLAVGGKGQGMGAYAQYVQDLSTPGEYIDNALVFEVDAFTNVEGPNSCYDKNIAPYLYHAAFANSKEMPNQCQGSSQHQSLKALKDIPGFSFATWVPLNFEWIPHTNNSGMMNVTLGGQVFQYLVSDVQKYFNLSDGNKAVYWGFTSATGNGMQAAGVSVMNLPTKETTIGTSDWLDFTELGPKSDIDLNEHFNLEMSRGRSSIIHPYQKNMAALEGVENNSASALWAKKEIDLTQRANGESYIYLGNYPNKLLADGLTLTFHNDPRGTKAIGGVGQGNGVYPIWPSFQNEPGARITNALTFEMDTYINNDTATISCYDTLFGAGQYHAGFVKASDMVSQCSGQQQHYLPTLLSNIQGFGYHKWVPLNFEWIPSTNNSGTMNVTLGSQVLSYPINDVKSYFNLSGEDKSVYWGFTSATGDGTQVAGVSLMKLPQVEANVTVQNSVRNAQGEDVNGKVVPQDTIVRYTTKITETQNITPVLANSRFVAKFSTGLWYMGGAKYKDTAGNIRSITLQKIDGNWTFDIPEEIKGKFVEISYDIKVVGPVGTNFTGNMSLQTPTKTYSGNFLSSTVGAKPVVAPTLTVNPEIVALPLNAPQPNVLQGVSANDNKDGDITNKIIPSQTTVDTSKSGQYIVNYQVTNSAGITTKGRRIYVIDGVVGQNYIVFANDFKITTADVDTLNPNNQILQRANARIEKLGEPGVQISPSDLVVIDNGGYQPAQHAYIATIGSRTDVTARINVRAVVGYSGPITMANNIKVVSNNAYLTKVEGAEFAAKLLTDRKWAEQYIIERAKAVSWNATTKESIQFQSVRGLEQINEVKKATSVQLVTAAGDEYTITVFVDYGNPTNDVFSLENTRMKIQVV